MISISKILGINVPKRFIELPFNGQDVVSHKEHGVGRVSGFSGSPQGESMQVVFPFTDRKWGAHSVEFSPKAAANELRILMKRDDEQSIFGRQTFDVSSTDIHKALTVATNN